MEAVAVNDQPSTNTPGNDDAPIVAVTFQKKPYQTQKYLEAEPKALGLTQIALSVFQISMVLAFFVASDSDEVFTKFIKLIGPLFAIIAGSIAIAAQNLHVPTLKACLGMQVVACLASGVNILLTEFDNLPICWRYSYNDTESPKLCHNLERVVDHYSAELLLINVAVLALCATLAAYCCKIINCCTPRANMPVITVNAPPPAQR